MTRLLAIILCALVLAACAVPFMKPDPRQEIIGEWRTFAGILNDSGDKKIEGISALQFYSDGSLVMRLTTASGNTGTLEGTYKFLDDNHIQLKFSDGGEPVLMPFEIDDTKLTLKGSSDEEGNTVLIKNTNH